MFVNPNRRYTRVFCFSRQMTVADIGLFAELTFVSCLFQDDKMTKEFTKLEALRDRVGKNEKIAAWVARRPDAFV